MNKNKLRMRADKLLKNLRQYESYAEYYEALRKTAPYRCGRLRQWKRAPYTTVRQ